MLIYDGSARTEKRKGADSSQADHESLPIVDSVGTLIQLERFVLDEIVFHRIIFNCLCESFLLRRIFRNWQA
jgi:hypothetical protein